MARARKLTVGKWYRVEWHDAAASCDGWNTVAQAAQNGVELIHTVGWCVKADDQQIILAQSMDARDQQVLNTQAIPAGWIAKVHSLG